MEADGLPLGADEEQRGENTRTRLDKKRRRHAIPPAGRDRSDELQRKQVTNYVWYFVAIDFIFN